MSLVIFLTCFNEPQLAGETVLQVGLQCYIIFYFYGTIKYHCVLKTRTNNSGHIIMIHTDIQIYEYAVVATSTFTYSDNFEKVGVGDSLWLNEEC